MIAFTLFSRPVYRYGIFYGVTFLFGYWFLGWIATKPWMKNYPQVRQVLLHQKDDLFLVCLLGVIVGGRLGHVFLYEWSYYSQHLGEILLINQGGMSFIGGVLGVVFGLIILIKRRKLTFESMKLLGDLVLCIVPVGIFLGRIGNGLNQELRGKPVTELSESVGSIVTMVGLTRIYPAVDQMVRVNTNLIQSVTEGLLTGIVVWMLLVFVYPKKRVPGLISGIFLLVYGLVRYRVEPLKDLPSNEMRGSLSVSQWIMIVFVVVGGWLVIHTASGSKKEQK